MIEKVRFKKYQFILYTLSKNVGIGILICFKIHQDENGFSKSTKVIQLQ